MLHQEWGPGRFRPCTLAEGTEKVTGLLMWSCPEAGHWGSRSAGCSGCAALQIMCCSVPSTRSLGS